MSGVLALLRRLRADRGVTVAVAITALLLTTGSVATLRSFTDISDDTLRSTVADATPTVRDVFARAIGTVEPADDAAFAPVTAIGSAIGDSLPRPIRRLVTARSDVVESRGYEVVPAAGAPRESVRQVLLTVAPAAAEQVRVVRGRLPRPGSAAPLSATQRSLLADLDASRTGPPRRAAVGPVLEVAMTAETLRLLKMDVGTSTVLAPNPIDTTIRRLPLDQQRAVAVEVVGVVEPLDGAHPLWATDTRVDRPAAVTDAAGTTETVTAGALLAPDAYADLTAATTPVPLAYTWRYAVDADRLHTGHLAQLRPAVARPLSPVTGPAEASFTALPRVTTGLAGLTETFAADRATSSTLLALAGAGLAGAAVTMLGLLAQLTAVRRAAAVRLVRDRGAGTAHVVAAAAVEALLAVGPAVLAGLALAWALVPARATPGPALLAAAIAAGFLLLLVAAAVPAARRQSGVAEPEEEERTSPARRIMLETLALVLAAAGLVALRRRDVDPATGVDPLLAAAPVLLAVAVAVPVLRAYPLPLHALTRRAARAAGLVRFLGLNRAVAAARLSVLPLLALLLAVGLAAFATVLTSTVDAGRARSAALSVGSDYRVDTADQLALGSGLEADLAALASLRGVRAMAVAYAEPSVQLVSADRGRSRPAFVAVDLAAYDRVTRGTDAHGTVPTRLTGDDDALPVAVTRDWSGRRLPVGATFELTIGARSTPARVAAVVDVVPGTTPGSPAVLVDRRDMVDRLSGFAGLNRVYLAAPASTAAALADRVAGRADITDRRAVLADSRSNPLMAAALDGVRSAAVAATVTGALALVLGVLLTARVRDRELVMLRTLGLPDRAAGRLVAVEMAPLAVTGLVAGALLGVALVPIVLPGIDPTTFTGPLPAVPTVVEPLALAGVVAAVTAVALLAVVLTAAAARRAAAVRLLRIGET